jgi:hypothetical protein
MDADRKLRRKRLELLWIAVGFGYSLFRVFIANVTVKKYGVPIVGFAAVEILSSFPYSLGTARVVARLVDRNYPAAMRWGVLAAATFVAPELYIVFAGHHHCRRNPDCNRMPTSVYVVLALIVVLLGTVATIGVTRKVKQTRRDRLDRREP